MRGLFFLLGILGVVLALNIKLDAKPLPNPVFPVPSTFELAEVEGLVANIMILNHDGINPQPTDCPCDGTKEIKSGDGLIKIPCPCTKNGECKCVESTGSQPEPEVAQVTLPNPFGKGNQFNKIKKKYILVYVGAKWCQPCVWMHNNTFPNLENKEWDFDGRKFKYSIGETVDNMIITLDYDSSFDELCEFLEIDKPGISLPSLMKIDVVNKKIVDTRIGSMSAEQVHKFYNEKTTTRE